MYVQVLTHLIQSISRAMANEQPLIHSLPKLNNSFNLCCGRQHFQLLIFLLNGSQKRSSFCWRVEIGRHVQDMRNMLDLLALYHIHHYIVLKQMPKVDTQIYIFSRSNQCEDKTFASVNHRISNVETTHQSLTYKMEHKREGSFIGPPCLIKVLCYKGLAHVL